MRDTAERFDLVARWRWNDDEGNFTVLEAPARDRGDLGSGGASARQGARRSCCSEGSAV